MAEQKRQDLVAFNAADAAALLAGLAQAGSESVAVSAQRPVYMMFGKSIGAIPAGGSNTVFIRDPSTTGWVDNTTKQVTAWNESSAAIAANKKLLLIPINGRWAAFELC